MINDEFLVAGVCWADYS